MFRKLTADEIEVRVGGVSEGKGGFLLLYKDARCDMRILDETLGTTNWTRSHEEIDGQLFCNVSIWDSEKSQWITKQDVGVESFSDSEKGRASDSFKRACFNLGIGRELYTAPFIWISDNKANKDNWKYKKFKVESIAYDEKGNISQLTINEVKGFKEVEVFNYRKGKNKSKPGTGERQGQAQEKRQSQKSEDKKTLKQNELLFYVRKANLKNEEVSQIIKTTFKKNSSRDLTDEETNQLIEYVKKLV